MNAGSPAGAAGGAGRGAGVEERFGPYGGSCPVLIAALDELTSAWAEAQRPGFADRLGRLLGEFVGRPTPLYHAARLSERVGRRVSQA